MDRKPLAMLAAVSLAIACRAQPPPPAAPAATRIAALSPASAEILCAVGCCAKIVVRSNWADYPAEVLRAPTHDGLYPSAEALLLFRPDLVVLNYPPPVLQTALHAAHIRWLDQSPRTVAEIADNMLILGQACGEPRKATVQADEFLARIRAAGNRQPPRYPVKVFVELDAGDGRRPFTIGNASFVDDVVRLAGGKNVFGARDEAFFTVDIEALLAADPDVIVLGDADVNTNPQSLSTLRGRPGFPALRAIAAGAVVTVPGSWFSRPGPRVALAVTALGDALAGLNKGDRKP